MALRNAVVILTFFAKANIIFTIMLMLHLNVKFNRNIKNIVTIRISEGLRFAEVIYD